MELARHHARCFAHELARRSSAALVDSFTSALIVVRSTSTFPQLARARSASRFSPMSAIPTANADREGQLLTFDFKEWRAIETEQTGGR